MVIRWIKISVESVVDQKTQANYVCSRIFVQGKRTSKIIFVLRCFEDDDDEEEEWLRFLVSIKKPGDTFGQFWASLSKPLWATFFSTNHNGQLTFTRKPTERLTSGQIRLWLKKGWFVTEVTNFKLSDDNKFHNPSIGNSTFQFLGILRVASAFVPISKSFLWRLMAK